MTSIKAFFVQLGQDIVSVSFTLFKVMIPAIVVVKILTELGAVTYLTLLLSPLMGIVGLPESMGVVWATTILTNLYTGLFVLYDLLLQAPLEQPMTVAEVSVLGALMLFAHALPVEVAIAKKSGVNIWVTLLMRIGGGFLFGWLLYLIYDLNGWMQTPAQLVWQPEMSTDTSLVGWMGDQLKSLLVIQLIIVALLFVLNLLKVLGIERLMVWLLRPVLRVLGISQEATSITIVGITLGLSFGGGLLIHEAKKGHVPARDVFMAITLLGLLHSLIEDTLLVLLLGADINAILWGRLLFSFVVIALLARLLNFVDEPFCRRYLYSAPEESKASAVMPVTEKS
ncbi:MAG: hypothetical protein ACPGF7_10275 [Pontibacterium sp.]